MTKAVVEQADPWQRLSEVVAAIIAALAERVAKREPAE